MNFQFCLLPFTLQNIRIILIEYYVEVKIIYKLKFILAFDAVIYIPCRMYNTCLQSLNTIAKRHEHNASYTFSFIHLWKKYNTPELNVDGVAINLRLLKYNVRW